MSPIIKELTNLLTSPPQRLKRTQTAFVDQSRITNSERFDLRFLLLLLWWFFLLDLYHHPHSKNYMDYVVFQCFHFLIWPWFSDLLSEPICASWRSIHCHFPLSGGTLILTREVYWPLLWPTLSRALFSLLGFSCHLLAARPSVSQTNAHRGAWVRNFCSPFTILDLCQSCFPAVLPTSPKWCKTGSLQG